MLTNKIQVVNMKIILYIRNTYIIKVIKQEWQLLLGIREIKEQSKGLLTYLLIFHVLSQGLTIQPRLALNLQFSLLPWLPKCWNCRHAPSHSPQRTLTKSLTFFLFCFFGLRLYRPKGLYHSIFSGTGFKPGASSLLGQSSTY